jgi:Trypsin
MRSDPVTTFLRLVAVASVLAAATLCAPSAGAMVGGTDQLSAAFAAPLAYIEIDEGKDVGSCTGTLISPTVVMTAAHCVYNEDEKTGKLIGIARPRDISVRVGSLNVSNPALGVAAGVVAVLPQPYYRWDGTRHFHDIALLALDRTMTQTPANLAEQRPDTGKALLISGYGVTSTFDESPPSLLRAGLIDAAAPSSCHLVSESFDPSWLFCGAAASDPTVPGGTACFGDSGGPAFAYENTVDNLVVEGVISYGSQGQCEHSRTYLVLVSSERGFIDRALATPASDWSTLRDDPPHAAVRPVRRHLGQAGKLILRVNDDRSKHSRVDISFFDHSGMRVSHAFRGIPTDRPVAFNLAPRSTPFNGRVCIQAADGTNKLSNLVCAADVVR